MNFTKSVASAAAIALLVSLSACSAGGGVNPAPAATSGTAGLGTDATAMLAQYNIPAPEDVNDLIEQLQTQPLTERPDGLLASVRVDELLLSDGDDEVSLALTDGQFHLSVAPYIAETHECFYHSLTTCAGELANAQLQVAITDAATGEVLVDQEFLTFDNGFFDVWLPSDRDLTLSISDGERSAEVPFGTGADDPTCLTSVQLS